MDDSVGMIFRAFDAALAGSRAWPETGFLGLKSAGRLCLGTTRTRGLLKVLQTRST